MSRKKFILFDRVSTRVKNIAIILVVIHISATLYQANMYFSRRDNPSPCPQLISVSKNFIDESRQRNLILTDGRHKGSGVNIGNGLMLTARHVVVDTLFDDIKGYATATLVINDQQQEISAVKVSDMDRDLALVRMSQNKVPKLKPINCAAKMPEFNTPVFVIGNPLDEENIVTTGTITGIGKEGDPDIIISDATSTFGNSGGGLYNALTGELLGIVQLTDGKRMYARRCTRFDTPP